jgi:ABC-type multidrug transport system permease subunit
MLIMFLMHNLSVSAFRLIGAVSRSMVLANTFGAFIILVTFLLGGFIIDKSEPPE